MPISVTATEVARNFNGVMEIIPIDEVKEEAMESKAVQLGKEFIDEYADVFAELAK